MPTASALLRGILDDYVLPLLVVVDDEDGLQQQQQQQQQQQGFFLHARMLKGKGGHHKLAEGLNIGQIVVGMVTIVCLAVLYLWSIQPKSEAEVLGPGVFAAQKALVAKYQTGPGMRAARQAMVQFSAIAPEGYVPPKSPPKKPPEDGEPAVDEPRAKMVNLDSDVSEEQLIKERAARRPRRQERTAWQQCVLGCCSFCRNLGLMPKRRRPVETEEYEHGLSMA